MAGPGKDPHGQLGQRLIRLPIKSLQELSGLFRCQGFRHLVVNRRYGNMQCAGNRFHIALAQGKIQQPFDQRRYSLTVCGDFPAFSNREHDLSMS